MFAYQGFYFNQKVRWKVKSDLAIIYEVVPAHRNRCEQAANTQNEDSDLESIYLQLNKKVFHAANLSNIVLALI